MTTTIRKRKINYGVCALARELGYSRKHIGAVLDGRRRPSQELLDKLKERGIKPRRLTSLSRQWN